MIDENQITDVMNSANRELGKMANGDSIRLDEFEVGYDNFGGPCPNFVLKGRVVPAPKREEESTGTPTMQEIIAMQLATEKRIAKELTKFEKLSGLQITDVDLLRLSARTMDGSGNSLLTVKVAACIGDAR